jgi:hypothetical protein
MGGKPSQWQAVRIMFGVETQQILGGGAKERIEPALAPE